MIGGIDLGGTKIEARLFDEGLETLAVQRVPTPRGSFEAFMAALTGQIDWLIARAGDPALPVGLSVAGVIDPETGETFTSNTASSGHSIGAALRAHYGRAFPVANDCMAFTLSEAHGGAAEGAASAVGLILGTGVGAGHVLDGALPPRHSGLAVEIGHVGMPARALEETGLPLLPCGCGKLGCMENYVSGTGLARIAQHLTGREMTALEIAADPEMEPVLQAWARLTAELLYTLQLTLAPEVIVLGGGVSQMPRVAERLSAALAPLSLGPFLKPTRIVTARHGDSSGARGMAVLAQAGAPRTTDRETT